MIGILDMGPNDVLYVLYIYMYIVYTCKIICTYKYIWVYTMALSQEFES